jgi:hypothetical protein
MKTNTTIETEDKLNTEVKKTNLKKSITRSLKDRNHRRFVQK